MDLPLDRFRTIVRADELRAPLWPLSLARMALGVMWLWALRWKLSQKK